jgi:hypothetical protein
MNRCVSGCTTGQAVWVAVTGGWTSDTRSFVLPYEIFKGDLNNPANDCAPAGPSSGCGHLIVGTTEVWETITGAAAEPSAVSWYENSPFDLTKGTLADRSYINQLAFEPSDQKTVIVGTNDGNVQIGFGMGSGIPQSSTWVDVTGNNVILPNRPILDVAFDPTTTTAPKAYAAVGGFNANTPTTPGHVFQVTCTANCTAFTWLNKTGNLPDIPVDSIIANPKFPQQVFAGTDWGLYFTNDITAISPTWFRFDTGLPHAMVWDMQIDRGNTTLSLWTRSRGAYAWPLPSAPLPVLTSVVSQKTHGSAGPFNVDLPLTGTRGVECRSGGANGDYTLIFTFSVPITNCGVATTDHGTATGGAPTGSQCTVQLSGVPNAQYTTVQLTGVLDNGGHTLNGAATMGVLLGDVNASGRVDAADVSSVRQQTLQTITTSNFRNDLNTSGRIDAADVSVARQQTLTSLPSPP